MPNNHTSHPTQATGGNALSSAASARIFGAHGGYRSLLAYQVAAILYDYTCRFCDRYVPVKDRHHDQMVQSARSGYQNIGEGSEDSATSKKLELNLTNVAKSSIGELRRDYEKYLRRRSLRLWQAGDPLFEEARRLYPKTVEEAAAWVNRRGETENGRNRHNGEHQGSTGQTAGAKAGAVSSSVASVGPVPSSPSTEERAANLGAILSAQAHYLTERLLDRQAQDFEENGGFSERLYRSRQAKRNGNNGDNGHNGPNRHN